MSKPLPPAGKRPRSLSYLENNGFPGFEAHSFPQISRTTSRSSVNNNNITTTQSVNSTSAGVNNYRGAGIISEEEGKGLSRIQTTGLNRIKSKRIEEEESIQLQRGEIEMVSSPIENVEKVSLKGKEKSEMQGEMEEEGEMVKTEEGEVEEEDLEIYNKFSERKKTIIVAIVSYSALLAPFSSASFLPSIPRIAEDLNTTATVLDISIACFILVLAFFPLIWAPYAGLVGRRPIYLISLPIFTLGSLAVALSPNLVSLFIARMIQGAGSSAVLSIGAGTICDCFRKEVRGKAMGGFYAGVLFGPALAPLFAGILTQYTSSSWRAMQWLLFAMGAVASVLVFCFLPETIHSKLIDSIREERRLIQLSKSEIELTEEISRRGYFGTLWHKYTGDSVFIFLNPLAPLRMLVYHMHILTVSLNSSFVLMSTYTVLIPLGQTLAPRYNITNAAILGCFYLASGIGNLMASQLTGKYADYMLAKWLRIRGVYVGEDRLRATLIGGGIVLPCSVLTLGWVLEKGSGSAGLAASIILLVSNGIGLMMVLTPGNTYCVDVFPKRSAEVIAVNNSLRYILSAAASAFVLPLIDTVGVGWTNTFSAGLCWVGFGLILLTIRYGAKWREWGIKRENYYDHD